MALIPWRKLQAGISGKGEVKDVVGSVTNTIVNTIINEPSVIGVASTTRQGIVELATIAETDAGTDATRAVTPDGLAGSNYGEVIFGMLVEEGATSLGTGDAKNGNYFRIPSTCNGWNIVSVAAQVYTVGSTGTASFQLRNVTDGSDTLSTKLTIDSGEKDSLTAATPSVINTANDDVATGDQFTWDVDSVHSVTAPKGLYCEVIVRSP